MNEWMPYASAWLVGFMGSSHCLVMCGGIVSAMSFGAKPRSPSHRLMLITAYNLGRLNTYFLLGLLAGLLSYAAMPEASVWRWPRIFSGVFMILLGLHVSGWWKGLNHIEKLGLPLWKKVAPLTRQLVPVNTVAKAWLSGLAWGLLPCGMVYSSLAFAASSGTPWSSAFVMLCFGLGTAPALLAAGNAASLVNQLLGSNHFRRIAGLLMIAFGIWTLLSGMPWLGQSSTSHQHHMG